MDGEMEAVLRPYQISLSHQFRPPFTNAPACLPLFESRSDRIYHSQIPNEGVPQPDRGVKKLHLARMT